MGQIRLVQCVTGGTAIRYKIYKVNNWKMLDCKTSCFTASNKKQSVGTCLLLFLLFCIITITIVALRYVLPSANWHTGNVPRDHHKPLCSMKLFEDIVRSRPDGVVSGNGTWIRHSNNSPDRFQPSICRLRHGVEIPAGELLQCLHSVKYIVLMGDSNMLRYYTALKGLLTAAGAKCRVIKTDKSQSHEVDVNYYYTQPGIKHTNHVNKTHTKPLIVHDRDCAGCSNEMTKCGFKSENISVIIERLALEFTNDAEVTSLEKFWDCIERRKVTKKHSLCRVSTTSQQFLLKEYLSSTTPTADLIVVFGNAHDSMRFTLREHAMNVRTFLDMINTYQPNTTRLVWTTKPGEYSGKKPGLYRGRIYENGTMNIMQWLAAANKIQFKEIRNWLINTGQPLAFLDLLTMSEPVVSDWNVDGVHMNLLWYQHVISYILQSFCAH